MSNELEQMYEYWGRMTPGHRAILLARAFYMLTKRRKLSIALVVVALAALVGYGVTHDPLTLAAGIVVGIVLALIVLWR